MEECPAALANIFNRPLLVSPARLPALIEAARRKALVSTLARAAAVPDDMALPRIQNGNAVIAVEGFLTYRYDYEGEKYYGETSYEAISARFKTALADPSVKNVVFRISSYGGEVMGLFDLVDEIYRARGTKPIYAVFDEEGFSAAFAIASAADRRYIPRTGSAGSVGVVAMHLDQSAWDARMGLKWTPIFAGARKVDFSSHAPLSDEAQSIAQAMVDADYDLFVGTVARNLGMTPAAVRATEAAIYRGKDAVSIGFADSVKSWSQFMDQLTSRKYGGIMKAELEQLWKEMSARFMALVGAAPDPQDAVTKADGEKLVAAAETAAKAEGFTAGREEGVKTGAEAERTKTREIIALCQVGGLDLKAAADLLGEDDMTVEKARAKVEDLRAAAANKNGVTSTVGATSTGEVNPLIADAKRRAEAAKAQARA